MTPDRARLLIVDDSATIRRVLRSLMHEVGFRRIDEAPDGAAALECFQTTAYDVVLSDWNMPYVSGIQLLRTIRHGALRSDTPLVLFTGDVSAKRMVEALEEGANGFLAKPFVAGVVCEKILRIVAALPPTSDSVWRRVPEPPRAGL